MQYCLAVRGELPFVDQLALGHVFTQDNDVEILAALRFMREKRPAQFAEVPERLDVVRVENAVLVRRDADVHRAAVSGSAYVELREIRAAPRRAALLLVVEPALAQRKIALADAEKVAFRRAGVARRHVVGIPVLSIAVAARADNRCARVFGNETTFVAAPAKVRIVVCAGEDRDVGLEFPDELEHLAEAIVVCADPALFPCAAVVSVAAVRTVEPHLEYVAIRAAEKFL